MALSAYLKAMSSEVQIRSTFIYIVSSRLVYFSFSLPPRNACARFRSTSGYESGVHY